MRRQPAWLLPSLVALVSSAPVSMATAQDLSRSLRELTDIEGDAAQLTRSPLRRSALRSPTHVEERLTDGELFFRLKDYVRASVIFTDIVDNYPTHRAYPDALFLLGESLFNAGDYLGARSRFRTIIERADQAAYRPYVQRSLGRLIEIATHIHDFDGVEGYFQRLAQLPPSEVEAATNYFRAKYLYSMAVDPAADPEGGVTATKVDQDRLERARVAFDAVGPKSPYYVHSRYFVGVIHTLRAQYTQAVEAFRRVVATPPQDEDQRRIVELAQLGVGRLLYEADQLERAIEAYQNVPRTSPLFDSALYEIAWVYIRRGDSTRAERSLEVLGVAVPDSQHIPDAKILRGNLLLRDGRFTTATEVFEDISNQFDPVRVQLDRIVAEHEDPAAYFKGLVRANLETFDASAFLPPLALRWASNEGDMERALAAVGDLSQARQLVRETDSIVRRLNGALAAGNAVNIFRDLRGQRERTTSLRNRLAKVRSNLAKIDERSSAGFGSAELTEVRKARRELERRLGGVPTAAEDMEARSARIAKQYDVLNKELSRLEVELMGMEARIVATDRFMSDTMQGSPPTSLEGVKSELTGHTQAVTTYRQQIEQLEIDVESARLQIGIGDQDDRRDTALREDHARLVERERQIVAGLGGRPNPQVDAAFARIRRVEDTLSSHDRQIDEIVAERVASMRTVLDEEGAKLDGYRARMAELETESEDVVGSIAYVNFMKVRERFYDLVLRADVGVIDVAWAEREEHRMRAEMLTRERLRTLKALDDEFREIMDRGEEP